MTEYRSTKLFEDTVQPLDNGEQNILIVNIYMDMHLNLKLHLREP